MKQPKRIFTAFAEVKPLPGCDIDADKIAGAFVRCHIPAVDAESATLRLFNDLAEQKLQLVITEWCVDHGATEWEKSDKEEQDLVEDARANDIVTYGDFHMWDHDASDAT